MTAVHKWPNRKAWDVKEDGDQTVVVAERPTRTTTRNVIVDHVTYSQAKCILNAGDRLVDRCADIVEREFWHAFIKHKIYPPLELPTGSFEAVEAVREVIQTVVAKLKELKCDGEGVAFY